MMAKPLAPVIGPLDDPTISIAKGERPGGPPSSGAVKPSTAERTSNRPLTGETITSGVATRLTWVGRESSYMVPVARMDRWWSV